LTYEHAERPSEIDVTTRTLDNPDLFPPSHHAWLSDAPRWDVPGGGLPVYQRGQLPDVAAVFAPVLARVSREQQPLLLAVAERLAAERYRGWAGSADPTHRADLLACAEREEEIARRVEALFADAAAIQRDILAWNPDLEELNRALFKGRPLEDQYTIQAQGERLGAATWRAFADHAPSARETFLACAELEEASAAVLEAILSGAG